MTDLINPYVVIGGAALLGTAQAWLTGSFWRERHKLGLSASAVTGFLCASVTFSFVAATCYELLVKAQGWTHPVVLHPAQWFEAIRHWLGITTLGLIQVPGLSSSVYGSLTAGKLQQTLNAGSRNAGAAIRSFANNGGAEVAGDAVGNLIDALARTPSPRPSSRFGSSGSSGATSSSSGRSKSGSGKSSSSSDSSGSEAAGGLGALLLAILRWVLKFSIVVIVLALGTGIAAFVMQLSAEYHESKRDVVS